MITCENCTFLNHADLKYCEICASSLKPTKSKSTDSNNTSNEANDQGLNLAVTEGCIELTHIAIKRDKPSSYNLCSPCPHITQSGFQGFNWSCGYRNIQMLCHTLVKFDEYKSVLFNRDGDIPDIHGIQCWIEKAWKAGFDRLVSIIILLYH